MGKIQRQHSEHPGRIDTARVFHVVVHDVAPRFMGEVSSILDEICPAVGNQVAAAVVPRWHGEALAGPRARDFARAVRARFGEVLLHGLEHKQQRASGVISALTAKANEFGGLSLTEAIDRLLEGHALVGDIFGEAPRGFVPPAWDRGQASMRLLHACGLSYYVGMTALERAGSQPVPLSTWSWDSGRLALLGHVGGALGRVMFAARPRSVPCVVLHPADVARGFVARAKELILALLADGRRPILFGELARPAAPAIAA